MRATLVTLMLALTAAPAAAETKIVVSFDNVADLPYLAGVKASLVEAAKKDPTLSVAVEEIGADPAKHLRNVEAAIATKANAVIINVSDRATGQQAAALAASSGMPLVFLTRRPTLDRVADTMSIVSSNDLVAGRIQTRVIAEKLGGKGTIAILRGPDADTAAIERRAGMQEILAGYPGLRVVVEASANWSRDEGQRLVASWLKDGRAIDAIVSANDEMALGAVAALRAVGLAGKVVVGGVDGSRDVIGPIKAGEMICSVYQNGSAQGTQALANAVRLARGESAQQYDWVPYELIVAGNAEAYAQR